MAKVTEVRLTLAAFIYALEIDLKNIINTYISDNTNNLFFLGTDLFQENIKKRFLKDFPNVIPEKNIIQLVDFIDFQDTYTIIVKNKEYFPVEVYNEVKSLVKRLDLIVPIRNRVMHTRPLQAGDFTDVYSFINELKEMSNLNWSTTFDTKKKIEEDPSYVLTLSIPTFKFQTDESEHNLPLPDFDETGFIGRKKDIEDVKKLILGNNRVVSIIGDGGIGKTALALKVAYDIVDLKDANPFDLIIWVSSKTTMLTIKGIEEIENALKDYAGVIEGISDFVKIKKTSNDKLNEILEYLDVFDVLLILDNLETILDESVREFIREAQFRCKIIITSRIGLGELEFRRTLNGLSEIEAITLIRQFANIKQSDLLSTLQNDKLVQIANKLHFNPLALKWFVNAVETGIKPDEVLTKKDDLLNFCLSNVYGKIGDNSKKLIDIILSARKSLNEAELIFLSELSSLVLRKSLNELFATTFIAREIENIGGSQEVKYNIPDFAKEYLLKTNPIKADFIQDINKKLKTLFKQTEQILRVSGYNEFGVNAISIRNSTEKVTARLLTEALKISKQGKKDDLQEIDEKKKDEALEKIEEAKSILPNYFEIYRISAFIKASYGDYLGAEQDYKIGLEIEPDNARLLYFYSGFLLYQLYDNESALLYLTKLMELRPNHPYPSFLYARFLSSTDKPEDAINLLRNLLNTTQLNDNLIRIAITDIIGFLSHWGQNILQKQGDYQLAKEKYLKGINYFERLVKERNFDQKMIKNFCSIIISFIKNIPRIHNEENVVFLRQLVVRYDDLIALNNSKEYIMYLLRDIYKIDQVDKKPSYTGVIAHFDKFKNFVFIQTEKGQRFYANRKAFQDVIWENLEQNDLVGFDVGTNGLGECAMNIIKI